MTFKTYDIKYIFGWASGTTTFVYLGKTVERTFLRKDESRIEQRNTKPNAVAVKYSFNQLWRYGCL